MIGPFHPDEKMALPSRHTSGLTTITFCLENLIENKVRISETRIELLSEGKTDG
jgi:hypothetical protein